MIRFKREALLCSRYKIHLIFMGIRSWTLKVETHDIGFRVLYENEEEIFSYTRCAAGPSLFEGSLICDRPGKCNSNLQ
jgi:hypothetical protein